MDSKIAIIACYAASGPRWPSPASIRRNSALRYFAGWERAAALSGDDPARQRADAAFIAHDRVLAGRERLADKAAARAPLVAGRLPSDWHNSPLDWYAWALSVLHPAARVDPGETRG